MLTNQQRAFSQGTHGTPGTSGQPKNSPKSCNLGGLPKTSHVKGVISLPRVQVCNSQMHEPHRSPLDLQKLSMMPEVPGDTEAGPELIIRQAHIDKVQSGISLSLWITPAAFHACKASIPISICTPSSHKMRLRDIKRHSTIGPG